MAITTADVLISIFYEAFGLIWTDRLLSQDIYRKREQRKRLRSSATSSTAMTTSLKWGEEPIEAQIDPRRTSLVVVDSGGFCRGCGLEHGRRSQLWQVIPRP